MINRRTMTQPASFVAPHRLPIRVYYEDTDLGQVVYYANYLKFIERGRSEWLRSAGIDQQRLIDSRRLAFVVRRVEADYLRPARFDDMIEVVTQIGCVSGSRIELDQRVERDGTVLFQAGVTLVCVDLGAMRAHRVPADVVAAVGGGVPG